MNSRISCVPNRLILTASADGFRSIRCSVGQNLEIHEDLAEKKRLRRSSRKRKSKSGMLEGQRNLVKIREPTVRSCGLLFNLDSTSPLHPRRGYGPCTDLDTAT